MTNPLGPERPSYRYAARVLETSTLAEIARELEQTDSDPEGIGIMVGKGRTYLVRLNDISLKASPLLKQEMLSVGGDAAQARGIADHSVASTPVVLLGTWGQYRRLLPKLERQPFGLKEIAAEVERALRQYNAHGMRTVRGAHRSFSVGDRPQVMGVVNVTPDSFFDGGKFLDPTRAIAQGERLVAEGADLLDIGGESTRPGSEGVTPAVEWARVEPVLRALRDRVSVPLSIDTRHPEVVARAVDAGVDVVNDVEGLRSPEMRSAVARSGAAVVLMHMRGTPPTMQKSTEYRDLRGEVFAALAAAASHALEAGLAPEQLLIDPGLGFGKSAEQSFELLDHLGELRSLGYPIVVGASRKSFLGHAGGGAGPDDRLEASLAAAVIAALEGASIVRVHDVGPTVRALRVVTAALRRAPPRRTAPYEE
jgi:dihydropteroate synthase